MVQEGSYDVFTSILRAASRSSNAPPVNASGCDCNSYSWQCGKNLTPRQPLLPANCQIPLLHRLEQLCREFLYLVLYLEGCVAFNPV